MLVRCLFDGRSDRAAEAGESSAIGFAAVTDTQHSNNVAIQLETGPVVASPQAILGWVDVLEFFHAASAGFGKTFDRLLDAESDFFSSAAISFIEAPPTERGTSPAWVLRTRLVWKPNWPHVCLPASDPANG